MADKPDKDRNSNDDSSAPATDEERTKKAQEGNATVDLPPGGVIPNATGPTALDTDEDEAVPSSRRKAGDSGAPGTFPRGGTRRERG